MKLNQGKAIKIVKEVLLKSAEVQALLDHIPNKVSFCGQGMGRDRPYRVGIYLHPPPPPLEELKKMRTAGPGKPLPCIAYCDICLKTGICSEIAILVPLNKLADLLKDL